MISEYEIGDTVLLKGTIIGIEVTDREDVLYKLREYNLPVCESDIVAMVGPPWELVKVKDK